MLKALADGPPVDGLRLVQHGRAANNAVLWRVVEAPSAPQIPTGPLSGNELAALMEVHNGRNLDPIRASTRHTHRHMLASKDVIRSLASRSLITLHGIDASWHLTEAGRALLEAWPGAPATSS